MTIELHTRVKSKIEPIDPEDLVRLKDINGTGGGGVQIDDTTASLTTVFSSNKTLEEIDLLIDDTKVETCRTYSSSKIESIAIAGGSTNATQLQGRNVADSQGANWCYVLAWDPANNQWAPSGPFMLRGDPSSNLIWHDMHILGFPVTATGSQPNQGEVLRFFGSSWQPASLSVSDANASSLQGRWINTTYPTEGQVLTFDGTNHYWEPRTPVPGGGSNATHLQGRPIDNRAPTNQWGTVLEWSAGSQQWTPSGPYLKLPYANQAGNIIFSWGPGNTNWGSTTGNLWGYDLYDSAGGTYVGGMHGRPIASTAPTAGQVLAWNAGQGRWEPTTAAVGGGSNATQLQGYPIGTRVPPNRYGTVLAWYDGNWAPSGPFLQMPYARGYGNVIRSWAAGQNRWTISTGNMWGYDLYEDGGGTYVRGIHGRYISDTAPTTGQVLTWNQAQSRWEPTTPVAGGGSNATQLQGRTIGTRTPQYRDFLLYDGSQWSPTGMEHWALPAVWGDSGKYLKSFGGYNWSPSGWVWEKGYHTAGDLRMPLTQTKVVGLQGNPVRDTKPRNEWGMVLEWNRDSQQWSPSGPYLKVIWAQNEGSVIKAYGQGFTSWGGFSGNLWGYDLRDNGGRTQVRGLLGRPVQGNPEDGQVLTWRYDRWSPSGFFMRAANKWGNNSWGLTINDTGAGEVYSNFNVYGWAYFANRITAQQGGRRPGGGAWDNLSSDIRTKEAVTPYHVGMVELKQLEPISYRYNGLGGTQRDGRTYYGLSANATQSVMPELVQSRRAKLHDEDGSETDILTMNDTPLLYAVINALKELETRIVALGG